MSSKVRGLVRGRGEGAQPNNMAPSKYGTGSSARVTILQQGIDSIWLNVYGVIREDFLECLAWSKEDAQAADADEALAPLPPFAGVTPLMLANGVKYYEWHARSRDIDVQIRKPSKRSPRPMAVIRVSAECLWRMGNGGRVAVELAGDWLRPIFEDGAYRVSVSRVHLATDYQGYVPAMADLENVVSRAGDEEYTDDEDTGNAAYRDRSKRLTGVASGKSNNLRLNMYDKVLQARKKAITWVADLWEATGRYDASQGVWRTEFQYGRSFLHDRGVETLADLWPALAGLWGYGMGWYTFRQPSADDSNRSRWAVASWWLALVPWQTDDRGELPKVKQTRASWRRIASGLAGYATSAMALTGLDDFHEALGAAIDHVLAGQPDRAFLQKKLAAKRLHYAGFTLAD